MTEALALAFVQFKQDRFTSNKFTTYLCTFFGEPFQPNKIAAVEGLLQAAYSETLVVSAPGPRGGAGYRLTPEGIAHVAEVDLPSEKFRRRDDLDDEKSLEASANIGPVFEQLLALLPSNKRERGFVQSLAAYWLNHGWLSSKQVTTLAEIAAKNGLYVEGRHYVGAPLDEWRQPYIDAALRRQAEEEAQARAVRAARDEERRERERAKAIVRDANQNVKVRLNEMVQNGDLSDLDTLVNEVFPGTSVSAPAKASAFAGRGSHSLRLCIAALAFGRPPSQVWATDGSYRQLGSDSEEWQLLISHPAFIALGGLS
jgi:hypothetical protein